MDKISVIVPIYNVEKYLRQCLDSIVNQTYQNLEIILVDDGSPDNCGAICDEYASNDNRIVVIHKKNCGVRAARNDGIERATGDWIAFVDSDDWCELNYYEKMLPEIENTNTDVIISGGYIKAYPKRGITVRTIKESCHFDGEMIQRQIMTNVAKFGFPWDKLYRGSFVKENKFTYDVTCKAFDDLFFNFQVFHKARFVEGNTVIGYHYRQVEHSIAHGYNPNKPAINHDFLNKINSYIHSHGMDESLSLPISAVGINAISVALSCYFFHPANPKRYREIAKEICETKKWRYYHEAIYKNNNKFLTKKQQFLKCVLRLPLVWPVKLLWLAKEIINRYEQLGHEEG